jgi:hypothetical protein
LRIGKACEISGSCLPLPQEDQYLFYKRRLRLDNAATDSTTFRDERGAEAAGRKFLPLQRLCPELLLVGLSAPGDRNRHRHTHPRSQGQLDIRPPVADLLPAGGPQESAPKRTGSVRQG